MNGLSVAFLTQGNAGSRLVSPAFQSAFKDLRNKGVKTEVIVSEEKVWDLSHIPVQHDLYVLISASPIAMSIAGALTINGAEVLNSFTGVNLCIDRIASTAVLASFGVPLPPSYATGKASLLSPLLGEGPLLIEERSGMKEREIGNPSELGSMEYNADNYGLPLPLYARGKVFSERRMELKLYVVGNTTWPAGKSFAVETDSGGCLPDADLDNKIRDAALACGKALSLEMYSVDFELDDGLFKVKSVNPFPGYQGAEKAASALSDYILRRAIGSRKGTGR